MEKQTFDYISLKPLADRFKEVAATITDEEIRNIIKAKLEEKVQEQIEGIDIPLSDMMDDWFGDDSNINWVMDTLKKSIENKLYEKRQRW